MVITNFMEFLFYDEIPACILFGFEIRDEIICEEITKSFDALFYISFIMALTIMLQRLTKLSMLFLKIVEYLFIVKFLEDSMANYSKNRTYLFFTSKFHLQNKSRIGVCEKKPCRHKLVDCFICTHNSNINFIKNKNSTISNFFTGLFNGFKSQLGYNKLEKNVEDIKLIFMNDKYCTDNKSKSNFRLNEYNSKQSLNICTDSSTTTVMKNDRENKHNLIMVTRDVGEREIDYFGKQESGKAIQHGILLSDFKKSSSESKNGIDIKEKEKPMNPLRCKNKYVHRIFHLMPVPIYPLLVLEKNHMRIVVKRYNNSRVKVDELNHKQKNNQVKYKEIDSIELKEKQPPLSATNSLLYSDTVTNSSIKRNDTYLLDNSANIVKTFIGSVKLQVPIKYNEENTANKATKLKENKHKNLLKYIESLNSDRKQNFTRTHQEKLMHPFDSDRTKIKSDLNNNSIRVLKNHSSQTIQKFSKPSAARKTDLKLENQSLNLNNKRLIKKYSSLDNSDINVTLNSSQLLQTINKNKVTDVRTEIVNTLVNLPRDTLTTMRYRYKLHKSNKIKKSTSNNNLDVIHENSSKSNLDTNEKVEK